MLLSKQTIEQIGNTSSVMCPKESVFNLPEKVLQFGTGVFIRGLIDYFINKANNEGVFNGRVVMVKSTDTGSVKPFIEQDGLYTLIMKSVDDGKEVEEKVICAAISRTLNAADDWQEVLQCAFNPDIQVIISNTTEVGIVLVENDSIHSLPPLSFPGKLLSFLFQRYKAFNGSENSGMVILPTELIPDNGTKLKAIVNELAVINKLDKAFVNWLNTANDWCNSLVDRIVSGKLPEDEHIQMEKELGYEDQLMIMAETFGLWAIETSSPRTASLLSFSKTHPGIHIVENIEKFRELKLRLLNGSHNLSCALGYIAGFTTVKEAMANKDFDNFMHKLILQDISAAILSPLITKEDTDAFGTKVLDRYRNPHISFEWLSICVQDTSKIKIRAVPIVLQHYAKYGYVPDSIALGFAAYILFMKSEKNVQKQYIGNTKERQYIITDDYAETLHEKWKQYKGKELVRSMLADENLWETNLHIPQFVESVTFYLQHLQDEGFFKAYQMPFYKAGANLTTIA